MSNEEKCEGLRHKFKMIANGEVCYCGLSRLERSPIKTPDGRNQLVVKPHGHTLDNVMTRAFEKAYNRPRKDLGG